MPQTIRYLIDGYNLMDAFRLLPAKTASAKVWEAARQKLLTNIATQGPSLCASTTVIFDAQRIIEPNLLQNRCMAGIAVRFAQGRTADDMIAETVEHELDPAMLTVVSNDLEVCNHARRMGCAVLFCDGYMQLLKTGVHPALSLVPHAEKPQTMTTGERDDLLKAFTIPSHDEPHGSL